MVFTATTAKHLERPSTIPDDDASHREGGVGIPPTNFMS